MKYYAIEERASSTKQALQQFHIGNNSIVRIASNELTDTIVMLIHNEHPRTLKNAFGESDRFTGITVFKIDKFAKLQLSETMYKELMVKHGGAVKHKSSLVANVIIETGWEIKKSH